MALEEDVDAQLALVSNRLTHRYVHTQSVKIVIRTNKFTSQHGRGSSGSDRANVESVKKGIR